MKYNNKISLGIFLSMLLVSSIAMATGPRVTQGMLATAENEIFAVDAPPFISSDLTEGGLNAAIVKAALNAVEVKSTVTILPVVKMVEYYLYEEQALAVFDQYMSFSDKDKKALIFVPIFHAKENYFYSQLKHKSGLNWQGSLSDLSAYSYGTYLGDNISDYKKAGIEVKFFRYRSLLRKLIAGEVDFIRMPDLTLNWMLDKDLAKQKDQIVAIDTATELMPQFVVFNKKHPDGEKMAKKLKLGLTRILDNGQYANILNNYLLKEDDVESRINVLRKLIQ